MKVIWLLEDNVFSSNIDALKVGITKQGFSYEVEPEDSGHLLRGNEHAHLAGDDKCVIFYGSLNLAMMLSRSKDFNPHIFCTFANYECTKYYAYFGKFLLNKNYIMLPFGDLVRQKKFLFERVGQNGEMFVRPSSGAKIFTGQVVRLNTFNKDVELLGFYDVPPEAMIVVAPTQVIVNEWRLVVADKRVIACSRYEKGNVEAENYTPNEVLQLAEEIVNTASFLGFEPDKIWTLDICQDDSEERGESFKLLEIGSFSCADLYKCDVEPVVREVSRIAMEIQQEQII
jgi:hypothetical protein